MLNFLVHVNSFHNLSQHPTMIAFIALFCLAFIFIVVSACLMFYYRRMRKTINSILEKIEIVRRLPLKLRLYRINEIAQQDRQLASKLVVWRTKYEILYEKELYNCLEYFRKVAVTPSNKVGMKIFNSVLQKISRIESEARNLLEEMENVLQVEIVQREYILSHKTLFNDLLEDAKKLQLNMEVGSNKMDDFMVSIEEMFNEFENYLNIGDFATTTSIIDNITTALIVFVEILDNVPQIVMMIVSVIPSKLEKLKEKYASFNQDYQDKGNIKLTIDGLAVKLGEQAQEVTGYIENLQYKKAIKLVNEMICELRDFDISLESQKQIINTYDKYHEMIVNFVERVEKGLDIVQESIDALKFNNRLSEHEELVYDDVIMYRKQIHNDTSKMMVDAKKYKNINDFSHLLFTAYELMKTLLAAQSIVREADRIVKRINNESNQLCAEIHISEVVLLQAEVRLNQLTYTKLVKKYDKAIEEYRHRLSEIKAMKFDGSGANSRYQHAVKEVTALKFDIFVLFEKIKNEILIDMLAQEAMVYVQKYLLLHDEWESDIKAVEFAYNNGELTTALQGAIKIMENNR